ncbi:MAG: multi-sensor signal transduction histidine kinase [Acidimicrobiales bacterium]|nr:multi-sensor signal transduction histidine kinase [Acidimicrobiales bacterium]
MAVQHLDGPAHPWVVSEQLVLLRRAVAELEEALAAERRRADALAAKVEQRTTFHAESEHKLKTELAVLCGWARTLDDRWMDLAAEDRRQGVAIIRARADGMAERATRMIEEAKAEIGIDVAEPVRLDLAAVLAATVDGAAGMSREHVIEVDACAGADVFVDPASLQQVLGHLLENAVKYSPGGGTIAVRTRRAGRWVELIVADEGVGIPDGVDLFAPFQRGNHAGISGTGLGLYIVAKLIDEMGGQIEARRNREAGSTFVVKLPAAR